MEATFFCSCSETNKILFTKDKVEKNGQNSNELKITEALSPDFTSR
jgi:hypothetical protein